MVETIHYHGKGTLVGTRAAVLLPEGQLASAKEKSMLWTIFVVLLVLWLLGMVTSYTLYGFIHLLLVIALVVLVIQLIQGRRVI
jgi:hypothetical protein